MEEISFTVSQHEDDTVRIGVAEPASIRVAGHTTFRSVGALERALARVGLPASLARHRGQTLPVPVTLVQLSRLGFL